MMTDNMQEHFPDLMMGGRLESMSWSKRMDYAGRLKDLIQTILEVHGPLPAEGIEYFLNQTYDLRIWRGDIQDTLLTYNYDLPREGNLYYTRKQFDAGTAPSIEAPNSYSRAYYHLTEIMQLIRNDPGLAKAPMTMLEEMLRIDQAARKRSP